MLIELNYLEVRQLAKAVRQKYGIGRRHSEILDMIADAVGINADAMMHSLKSSNEARLRIDRNALGKLASALSVPFISTVTVEGIMSLVGAGDPSASSFTRAVIRSTNGDMRIVLYGDASHSETTSLDAKGVELLAAYIEKSDLDFPMKITDYGDFAYQIDILAVPASKYKEPAWKDALEKRMVSVLETRFAEKGWRYIPA